MSILLSLLLLETGCVHYLRGDFANIQPTTERLAIYVDSVSGAWASSISEQVKNRNNPDLKMACKENTTRLNIMAAGSGNIEGNPGYYLSVLTLGLLPTYWPTTGVVIVEVMHNGQLIREFQYRTVVHTWYGWIPFLFASALPSSNLVPNEGVLDPEIRIGGALGHRVLDRLNIDLNKAWPEGLCIQTRS